MKHFFFFIGLQRKKFCGFLCKYGRDGQENEGWYWNQLAEFPVISIFHTYSFYSSSFFFFLFSSFFRIQLHPLSYLTWCGDAFHFVCFFFCMPQDKGNPCGRNQWVFTVWNIFRTYFKNNFYFFFPSRFYCQKKNIKSKAHTYINLYIYMWIYECNIMFSIEWFGYLKLYNNNYVRNK